MGKLSSTYGAPLARAAEVFLCTAVSAALCYTIQGGFNVSEAVHGAIGVTVFVCLVLQGILLAGWFAPRARVASFSGYAVVALGACAATIALAPAGNPIADVPENLFVTAAIFALVNLLVFASTRRRVTCLVLFGLGAFICGLTQFLYTTNMLVATMAFLVSSGMLIAFKAYSDTAALVSRTNMPLFGKASIVGSLLPLAACAFATVFVVGIIMPLDPPHASIKLFNEYLSYEEDLVKTSVELDENAEKTLTSSTVDEALAPRTTTDLKVDESAPQTAEPDNAQHENSKDYLSGEYSDVDISGIIENMQSLAFDTPIPWWLIILLVLIALLLLLILPRLIVHHVRLKRIASRPPGEQIALLYGFFLGRFKKLGLEKPSVLSPVEYANLFRERISAYVGAREAGSFDHLTTLFVQKEYAGIDPDDEDLQCMYWLYWMFYRRCRKELGLFKYGFRFLTL